MESCRERSGGGFQKSDFAFWSLVVSLPNLRPGECAEVGIELGDICASGTSLSWMGQDRETHSDGACWRETHFQSISRNLSGDVTKEGVGSALLLLL